MFAYIYLFLHSWNPFVLCVFPPNQGFFSNLVLQVYISFFWWVSDLLLWSPLVNRWNIRRRFLHLIVRMLLKKPVERKTPVFWEGRFLANLEERWDHLFFVKTRMIDLQKSPNKFRIHILWIKYVEVWWGFNYEIITWWSLCLNEVLPPSQQVLLVPYHFKAPQLFSPPARVELASPQTNWMTFSPKSSASKVPSYHWFHGVSLHV